MHDAGDIFFVLMAVDALRRRGAERIGLFAPYIPYARQDRVSVPGEALGAGVFARLLNSLALSDVYGLDIHSDVAPALINNYRPLNWLAFANAACAQIEEGAKGIPLLIAPDAGAAKKIAPLAAARLCDFAQANKHRDPATGKVTVHVEIPKRYRTAIIVDDICDGGATFTEIAAHAPESTNLHLVVSHGIFSKGIGPLFDAGFMSIHTTDSWGGSVVAFPEFFVHSVPTEVAA